MNENIRGVTIPNLFLQATIIGGHDTGNIVAEYKDDKWRQVATLKQGRSRHSTIVLGSQTIIIGGTHTFDAK